MLLAGSIGSLFAARISGVTSFGLFVTLLENGADGLVPISTLPSDYYDQDMRRHRLIGRDSGRVFKLGDDVLVRLVEADGIGGRLMFRIEEAVSAAGAGTRVARRSRRVRPATGSSGRGRPAPAPR